jgi:flagellar biosynthesis protein FlhG
MNGFHTSDFQRSQPADQADGLRRLFGAQRTRFVALVANPHIALGGVLIERLTSAFARRNLHTLVVDAADSARAPHELARLELASCVESLSPEVSFLAARGLPIRYVDARGSTEGFLDALVDASPQADVVLVHAGASDLARLFMRRAIRPLLMADATTESVTGAYAAMKVLAQRANLLAYDLLVPGKPNSPLPAKVAQRLAECADHFLGAALHDWVAVDTATHAGSPVSPELLRLAFALLDAETDPVSAPMPADFGRQGAAWTN